MPRISYWRVRLEIVNGIVEVRVRLVSFDGIVEVESHAGVLDSGAMSNRFGVPDNLPRLVLSLQIKCRSCDRNLPFSDVCEAVRCSDSSDLEVKASCLVLPRNLANKLTSSQCQPRDNPAYILQSQKIQVRGSWKLRCMCDWTRMGSWHDEERSS